MSLMMTSGIAALTAWSAACAAGAVVTFAPRFPRITDSSVRESSSSSMTSTEMPSSDGGSTSIARADVVAAARRSLVGAANALSGSVSMNVAPLPTPALLARTVPP